jgi:Ca2+/Na+ antiporter
VSDEQKDLGKLKGIFPISPALAQRAVFVAVLSFMFFMTMMFAFYLLQNIIYFVLSTAFLVLYLIMMFAWLMQKRSAVELFEKGITLKKRKLVWDDIVSIDKDGELLLKSNEKLLISTSIHERNMLMDIIRRNIPRVS